MRRVAHVDRAVLVAAARADQKEIVNARGNELRKVALDAVIGRVHIQPPVDQRGKTGKLRGRLQVEGGLRGVVPREVHRAVPDLGGEILRAHGVSAVGAGKAVAVARFRLLRLREEVAAVRALAADGRKVEAVAPLERAGHFVRRPCGGDELQKQAERQKQGKDPFFHNSSVTIRLRTVPDAVGVCTSRVLI